MKVKIKKLPNQKMAYGGRVFNQVAPNALPDHTDEPMHRVKSTLQPVNRENANIEAEQGETAFFLNEGGLPAHFKIGGKRHSQGGTPLNVPEDTFIFSDTKSMKIKDPNILKFFGETSPKTPADIAKKYDINKYRKVLSDPNSDPIQIRTAEKMIAKYNVLLGKLALAQESKKGFPQGVPAIALPFIAVNNIDPKMILPLPPPDMNQTAQMDEEQEEPMEELQEQMPMAMYGGSRRVKIKSLPKAQNGIQTKDLMRYNQSFWDEYNKLVQDGKIKSDIPSLNFSPQERQRRSTQKSKGQNIYGDLDWSSTDLFNDFKRRHAWYLEQNPNFNPHSKKDVEHFQYEYCKKASAMGMSGCYFIKDGTSGTGFDGKFGEHTWSAPGFNKPAEQPVVQEDKKQDEIEEQPLTDTIQDPTNFEFFPQDVANLATAMSTRIPRPKTFYQPLLFRGVDPAFITPDYSPIMEAANQATAGLGIYGSRQSADASMSRIQGMAARQAADHNLQVANANAGIYNNAEQYNAQIANANAQYNAQAKQMDFDAREAYASDFIKARNKKRADITNMANNMLTNAVSAYNLNQLYPHYQISPSQGGRAYFDRGEMIKANEKARQSELAALDNELKELGYTREERLEIIKSAAGSKYKISGDNYLPDYGTGAFPPGFDPNPFG